MTISWMGTSGNDTYDNAASENMIAKGREGNDFIWTGSGNDAIYGEAGNDTLKGWSGDDLIIGGDSNAPESDVLYGEAGNDKLYGWSGDDILDGGSENDTLVGGTGADTVTGGTGADKFTFQAQAGNTNLADFGVDVITDFQYGQEDKLVLWSGFGITLEDFDGIGDDKITSEFQVGQGETVYFDASPNDGVSPVPIALLSSITADYQFIPSLDIELI